MLKPTSDRLDYGKLLSPPTGYEVVFAAGTTYSLDMDALVGICIALGLSENIDGSIRQNPICLLEALRKTADKIVLFCEGGQIKAPAKVSPLYILLEKIVFEVNLPNKKSFHPKFWLIKYENADGDILYRCLVLSRNLTFDRSWDVAFCIEGKQTSRNADKSEPISDFLRYLTRYTKANDKNAALKKRMLAQLADELNTVAFSTGNDKFDFQMCPVGIMGSNGIEYGIGDTNLFDTYHDLLIISPFLSGGIIEHFAGQALKDVAPMLITRKSELCKIRPEKVSGFEFLIMKETVVHGEESFSEDTAEKQSQDIHAKVYLRTKYSDSDLYIGSLNASQSACYGNVEFMVRLLAKRRYLNIETLKRDLFGGDIDNKDNPFELAELPGFEETPQEPADRLQKLIKEISCAKATAEVREEKGKFTIRMIFEKLPAVEGVYIAPLLSNREMPMGSIVEFPGLELLQLSEFYRVKATDGDESISRVIKVKTTNIPENRENTMVNNIISDKQSFIQYIAFLLGDDYLLSLLENNTLGSGRFTFGGNTQIPALYERMLKTAASAPERFSGIDYLMKMITDQDIIPNGFGELYAMFKKAVNKKWK